MNVPPAIQTLTFQTVCKAGRGVSFLLTLALSFLVPTLISFLISKPIYASAGRASLLMSASPDVILADGKNTTTITASVRDGDGNLAADGTSVRFTTSLGTFETETVSTKSGVARAILTSAAAAGTAEVTATAFVGAGGSSTGQTHVEFTSDRDALFASEGARWIHLDCPQTLVYSADDKIVDATGRKGSAHLQFKSLEIHADTLQLDLGTQTLVAKNAVLQRGKHTLRTVDLRYNIGTSLGTAVVANTPTPGDRRAFRSILVHGYTLDTEPQPEDAAREDAETNLYRPADISDSKVIVSARAIAIDPSNKIQFRRATIYSDGKKVLAVALHVMPLSTEELFGQQLVGFGTQGLFVNVPYYYNVSPKGTGTIYLRNSAVAGSGQDLGSSFSQRFGSGSRPGLALDLEQTYAAGSGGNGAFALSGLTRSDWGMHWNHSQRIDEMTNGYVYLDSPTHRSLFGSSSLSRQFRGFSLNFAANGSKDPGFLGYSSSSTSINAYLQTTPRPLGQSGVNFSANLSTQVSHFTSTVPVLDAQNKQTGTQIISTPSSTRGLDLRFFTAPLHPNRRGTFTNSLSLGQAWDTHTGESRQTVLGTLAYNEKFSAQSNLSLNYTYRYDPLRRNLSDGPEQVFLYRNTQQRLGLNFISSPTTRLSLSVLGSYALSRASGGDTNLFTSLNYRLDTNWGFGIYNTLDRYGPYRYQDTGLSVSRRILGRDVVFSYTTQTRKVHFDFGFASF